MRLPRTTAALVVAVAVVTVTGCTSSTDKPKLPASGHSPTTTATVGPTPAPTATSPTVPSLSPTAAASPQVAQLLPTAQVPGLNSKWHWQDGRTGSGDTDPFGICAKADLGSIGALQVLERSYFPPDDSDDNAAEQVATFADAKSVGQAWSVLNAWRSTCVATIGAARGPKVTPMTPVELPGHTTAARWYLVSWTPAGEETGRFEALGMVRFANWIAVLRITNSGQDYNYPAGKEPMVTMIQRAAAKLLG